MSQQQQNLVLFFRPASDCIPIIRQGQKTYEYTGFLRKLPKWSQWSCEWSADGCWKEECEGAGMTVNLLICCRSTAVLCSIVINLQVVGYNPLKWKVQIRHSLYLPMILSDPHAPPCLLHLDFPGQAQGRGSLRASNTGLPRTKHWATQQHCTIMTGSVADPDPYVFGPPGSGSISQRHVSGSGSFYIIKEK